MPEWQDIDENRLLEQAQNGDAEAFGQLYEHFATSIYRFLFAKLSSPQDAEDLTGEVFLRTWQALPSYRRQGAPFAAFLFQVARNALIDQYRRSGREGPNLSPEDDQVPDQDADPADAVALHFEHQELHHKLGQLREDYRLVLELRFLGELSPTEIASVMERTPGAVRVLQHRALKALRKLMPDSE
jgi:RNA polymerase sigma-70 factor (ECF subfamily)